MYIRNYLTIAATLFIASMPVQAGDAAAGKAKVAQQCAECHRPSDWDGETTAQLEALLRDIASGKVAHRKRQLQLSEQDISDIAVYWTSGRKK